MPLAFQAWAPESLQFRVLGFGLLQDGIVGAGVFPEREKVLIRRASLGGITLLDVSAGKAEMSERSKRLVQHNSTVVKNLLEFSRSFAAFMRSEIRFPTHKDRIQGHGN